MGDCTEKKVAFEFERGFPSMMMRGVAAPRGGKHVHY